MIFSRAFNLPVAGLIFSILGLVYCLLMSLGVGVEAICLTSGCALVADVRIAGISPWWAATALFGLMTLFSIFRLRALAYGVALLFLMGDCLFLLLMIFIAPCTSCLLVALLIFGAWVSLRWRSHTLVMPRRILAGGLGAIWSLLFILNIGTVLHEIALPKAISGGPESKIDIYFSPGCPACVDTVRYFDGQAAFYPVAESEEDIAVVADLQARMAAVEGQPASTLGAAMAAIDAERKAGSYRAPELSLWKNVALRFTLMRNQSRISQLGFEAVPVIMFEGVPRSWAQPVEQVQPGQPGKTLPWSSGEPASSTNQSADQTTGQLSGQTEQQSATPETGQEAGTPAPTQPDTSQQPAQTTPDTTENSNGWQGGASAPSQPADQPADLPADLLGDTRECGGEARPCD